MWGQLMSLLLGIWLMAAPSILEYGNPAAANDWIMGPLVATFATIALWEITRSFRRMNLILGVWLLMAPFVFSYSKIPMMNDIAVGILLTVFSLVRGKIRHSFGGGWSSLWKAVGCST